MTLTSTLLALIVAKAACGLASNSILAGDFPMSKHRVWPAAGLAEGNLAVIECFSHEAFPIHVLLPSMVLMTC